MAESKAQLIRRDMPLLARAEGVWEGWYRYYDAATGKLIDQHRSRLLCRIPEDSQPSAYHQTNHYFWEDGRVEIRDFPADYADGRVWWDNEHIKGWAAQMQPDDLNRSTCLNWTRKGDDDMYLYEMIQSVGNNRSRTWQWFRNDKCFQRTLIDEIKVSDDWRSWTDDGPPNN